MKKTTGSVTFRVTEQDIRRLLEQGRHPYWLRLNANILGRLLAEIAAWPAPPAPDPHPARSQDGQQAQWLADFFKYSLTQASAHIRLLRRRHGAFVRRFNRMHTESERQEQILAYAQELGAGHEQLVGDRRAFQRWFGFDAMADRFQRQVRSTERDLCLRLDCLGQLAALALTEDGPVLGHAWLWRRLDLEPALAPLFKHGGDPRVATAALRCLSAPLLAVPSGERAANLDQDTLLFIQQTAMSADRDVWLQAEALALLQTLAPRLFAQVARGRLARPAPGDDLFPRRRILLLIGAGLDAWPEWAELLTLARRDPSPYPRQALSQVLAQAPAELAAQELTHLTSADPEPAVRAAALWNLGLQFQHQERRPWVLELLASRLDQETDALALRVALTRVATLAAQYPDWAGRCQDAVATAIQRLRVEAPDLRVRRWAAQAGERLWCEAEPAARQLRDQWREFLDPIPPGATRRLPRHLTGADGALTGRILAVLAQEDFGADVEWGRWGGYVTRGPLFGRRLWRLLHEFRHPSPDKRQAFSHSIGRRFFGNLRAPSARLAELAETKVPGEPLHQGSEDGWRPYLPLVDEVLACLAHNQGTRIHTAEGVTELTPPRNPLRRLAAHWRLTWRFPELARLRNYREGGESGPDAYARALAQLGVGLRFHGHGDGAVALEDPAVRRFFPAWFGLPVASPEEWWGRFSEYFVSVYQNSLFDLALYLSAASLMFFGRHVRQYQQMRRARSRLPLVIGGWGTRGKSGTERLKAALVNAMGYAVLSKTTGCEAMFLHAYPFGTLKEMFLFRPYDKATIWEQHNLVRFADAAGSEVFLWECMALTPSYVRLLQRQWMRDDIATLTNAYPDHEDIQGPAGINIPQVMSQFIPERAALFTSEEQMLPLFRQEARRVGTRLSAVGWLEAGLLPPDILGRFSYDEHPYNIALVLALAKELQVPEDLALKEMADRVVPDLGVLKTFPAASWRGRTLEFSNGMSANERFGCLTNWQRLGLDRADPDRAPDTWISLVVNNRADRVARSQVFAGVLVKDLSADRILLIGGNLAGLQDYIRQAWDDWTADLSLAGQGAAKLEHWARRLRVPYRPDLVASRLRFMLVSQGDAVASDWEPLLSLWDQPAALAERLAELGAPQRDELLAFHQQSLDQWSQYQALAARLQTGEAALPELEEELRARLWQWFQAKLVVVWDYHASGDKVVEHLCDACPPGFYNRILGIQNIKGTGLDFVYRWQAWDQCHRLCADVDSCHPTRFAEGLRRLSLFTDHGVLCEERVRASVALAKTAGIAQQERFQAELNLVLDNLEQAMLRVREGMATRPHRHWLERVADALEAFLDAGDAVRRRKRADQIYRDLIAERIGQDRAVLELQALNKRQQGHWLSARLAPYLAKR